MLHLGQGNTIPAKDVVLIADWEATTDSQDTIDFLDISEEEGFIIDYTAEKEPKSFVVTEEKIYYSIISSETLRKRMNFVYDLE